LADSSNYLACNPVAAISKVSEKPYLVGFWRNSVGYCPINVEREND